MFLPSFGKGLLASLSSSSSLSSRLPLAFSWLFARLGEGGGGRRTHTSGGRGGGLWTEVGRIGAPERGGATKKEFQAKERGDFAVKVAFGSLWRKSLFYGFTIEFIGHFLKKYNRFFSNSQSRSLAL